MKLNQVFQLGRLEFLEVIIDTRDMRILDVRAEYHCRKCFDKIIAIICAKVTVCYQYSSKRYCIGYIML